METQLSHASESTDDLCEMRTRKLPSPRKPACARKPQGSPSGGAHKAAKLPCPSESTDDLCEAPSEAPKAENTRRLRHSGESSSTVGVSNSFLGLLDSASDEFGGSNMPDSFDFKRLSIHCDDSVNRVLPSPPRSTVKRSSTGITESPIMAFFAAVGLAF